MRYEFIGRHVAEFPVVAMCRVLKVSRSGFYAWKLRPDSPRVKQDRRMAVTIATIQQMVRRVYGAPRVHRELKAQGKKVSRKRVARLMRQNGLQSRCRRKFRVTTQSNHSQPVAPDRLERDFTPKVPNQAWVADITYIATREGWMYLAVVLDLYSRMVVGWQLSERLTRQLVVEALQMGLDRRKPSGVLVHHSDRGSQYASGEFRQQLKAHGILASMSRKGNCWDNAVAESLFASLKTELDHQGAFQTREQARREIFEYVEVFYNGFRRHSTLGYVSPREFEQRKSAA
jgi:transposase InsO family protein